MTKKKRKNSKRNRAGEVELHLVELEKPVSPRSPRRGEFLWGLAIGLLGALTVVTILDHVGLTGMSSSPEGRSLADAGGGDPPARSLVLAGFLPRGSSVFVDGESVEAEVTDRGMRLEVEPSARRLEVRGSNGPWWTTSLASPAADGDTLRPVLTGDLVVEVDKQGPAGELFVDGLRKGTAPGSAGDVTPGWHLVSIRSPGGGTLYENGVEITPGDVSVLRVPPVPPRGKAGLVVRARQLSEEGLVDVAGASVFVDGKQEGVTPLELTVPAGHHSIRVVGPDDTPLVEAVFLEAGRSRYVDAQFGGEERLEVQVMPPLRAPAGSPIAIAVSVAREGKQVILREGKLQMIRAGQSTTIPVPLVASTSDPGLWVGVLPPALSPKEGDLIGFATCVDEGGRTGTSDLFRIPVR